MRTPTREDFAQYEKKRHRARSRDPGTSHEAAENVRDQAGYFHFMIWISLRLVGPMTSEELLLTLGDKASSPGGTRTRIKTLEREGWIEYQGEQRKTKSGSFARVMRARIPASFYVYEDPAALEQGELFDE
jgi:hypothetical protein